MCSAGPKIADAALRASLQLSARRRLLESQDDESVDLKAIVDAALASVDVGERESFRPGLMDDLERFARELGED